jgi:5'-3' exonuclease
MARSGVQPRGPRQRVWRRHVTLGARPRGHGRATGQGDDPVTLMLLDSASLYFRAFFGVKAAMPAPDGTPTNAVRGFLDMVSTLVTRFRPSDLVACLDEDWRPAWRVALVPSYKTHRLASPEEALTGGAPPGEAEPPGLSEQVPIILEALEALGIAVLGAPDHEADDVLASLAERASQPVDVVTGDRDLFQLIDDERQVRVLYTGRGVAKLEIMNAAALRKRYGIEPAQYADFATLRGDPSDGLPGVPGIGEKTAASLLATFGTLEGLLEAAERRDRRLSSAAGKLGAAKEYLERAVTVVRTVRDLPLPKIDTTLPSVPHDSDKLIELDATWGIGNPLGRAVEALSQPRKG